jgi:RNA polymerase sigma factor (sigma-70 family)
MKQRPQLTPEQQQLVSRVLPHALRIARKHTRRYGPFLEFESSVALQLCQKISLYNPEKGDLVAWANWQAHFACREQIRGEVRRKNVCKARFLSLDASPCRDGTPLAEQIAAPAEPPVEPEAESHLLRGLDTRTRTIVWKSVVEGLPLKTVAQSLGVSESRACEIRSKAIEFLRRRAIA